MPFKFSAHVPIRPERNNTPPFLLGGGHAVGACSAPSFYPLSPGFASLKFSSSRADNTSMAGRASTFHNNHLTGNSLIYTSTYLQEAPGLFLFQDGKPSPLGQVADFAKVALATTAERDKWLCLRDLRLGVFEGTAPSCQQVIP